MTKKTPENSTALNNLTSDAWFGGDGSRQRAASELFLPSIFGKISCQLLQFHQQLININKIKITAKFVLSSSPKVVSSIYKNEEWKQNTLNNLLRDTHIEKRPTIPYAPLMIFVLDQWINIDVESINLNVNNNRQTVFADNTVDYTFLPNSRIPIVDEKKKEIFSYYSGKSVALFASLAIGQEYSMEFEINAANPTFDYLFLLPFGNLQICQFSSAAETDYFLDPSAILVSPYKTEELPDYLQKKCHRITNPHLLIRPIINSAGPYRDTDWSMGEICTEDIVTKKRLSGYCAIAVSNALVMPKKTKQIIVVVETTKNPIPIRQYRLMEKLPAFQDYMVTYDIFNFDTEKQEFEIYTEILDYSHPKIINICLQGTGHTPQPMDDRGRCRERVFAAPTFKNEAFKNTTSKVQAEMLCRVTNKKTGEIVFQVTKTITLLPRNYVLFQLNDKRANRSYDLLPLLCAWVSPTDPDGLLDAIRGKAAKYHQRKALVGSQGDLISQTSDVRAIYDYLSKEKDIKYVNQPFYFDAPDGQRVLTATEVINSESGNCIDLVILFAGLLEGLGINPLIMLIKGHAFLGWGDVTDKADKMDFLECTLLGRSDFETARAAGYKKFKENFFFIGSDALMPNDLLLQAKGSQIINLKKCRSMGISAFANEIS